MVEKEITIAQHIKELKKRSEIVLYSFLVLSVIGFSLHTNIGHILQKPLGQTLYYSNPAGGLSFVMQISLGFGFLAVLPLAIYEILQFIRPTFKPVKTRLLLIFTLISMLLTISALLYSYYISLPSALKFLVNFNSETLQALINVNDYMRFILAYMAGAIIAFQLPLILYFANKIKHFPPGGISKTQRPVIAAIVIISGIITPTIDPINQLLLAAPMFALYELGILAVVFSNRKYKGVTVSPTVSDKITTPLVVKPVPQLMTDVRPMPQVTPRKEFQYASAIPAAHRVHMDIVDQRHLVRSHA